MTQTSWKAWVKLGTSAVSGPFIDEVTIYDQSNRAGYQRATITLDHPTSSPVAAGERVTDEKLAHLIAMYSKAGSHKSVARACIELQERRASSPPAGLVENLRFERNFLQKLCAQRAYALDEIGEAAAASEYLPDLVSKIGKILETASSTSTAPPAGRDEIIEECAKICDERCVSATAPDFRLAYQIAGDEIRALKEQP